VCEKYNEEAAKTASPVDVALSSWPSVASKTQKWTDMFFDRRQAHSSATRGANFARLHTERTLYFAVDELRVYDGN